MSREFIPRPPFMKLAVIGDPIEHSRSPELHARFLAEAHIPGSYERILVRAHEGAASIDALRARRFLGLNVTTPLKEEAFARAERHDATALATGSVNTLLLGGVIEGYNTDGIGTLGVLEQAGLRDPHGAQVLVLGVGPTARSAVAALRIAGADVILWNRTRARAVQIARQFDARIFEDGMKLDAVFSALPPNAVPDEPGVLHAIESAPILADANYGDRATLAAQLGRNGTDGSAMLEHSARASFEIWRKAATKTVAL